MSFAKLSLKGRALKLLASREHSRQELTRKLTRHVEEGDDLPRILDELEAKGFIDEQRVVESVVNRRARRLGAGRVRQEMQAKGLSQEAIAEAVSALEETEVERARAVWKKKFGEPADDPQGRAKQMRFLASRGFAPGAIRKVVSGGDED
ncbi:recombination regulator RecX [Hydrogenophaga sp. 5NK40-0174]|uniref:recombination regulator RecX n=1 Tax=Hydrogenophaga sp. 5NK40-0174 TaxID=3127649 RepID=UPI0031075FB4